MLSEKEFKIFEEYYPGKFESETDTESDRPIVIVTKIDEDVSKETGLKVGDIIIENEYDAYKEI